jgi:pimeloyl-ACP methyl ester carboxylesterase
VPSGRDVQERSDAASTASLPGATSPTGYATSADDGSVAYYDFADTGDFGDTGRTLLLAHATGFCGLVLEPLVRALDGVHAVTLDERGHGASPRPVDGDYDWLGFAHDVLAVVDHLGLTRPIAFGHSCGGAALLLAEASRPGTFAALYCFEPIVHTAGTPLAPNLDNPLSAGALRRRTTFASRADALANYAGKPPFDRLRGDVLERYVDNGFALMPDDRIVLRCRREDEAAVYARGLSHDAFARLAAVRCPVTLACGEATDAMRPELLARMAQALPHATVEVLPGLGHFGPLEDPDALAASVTRAVGPWY